MNILKKVRPPPRLKELKFGQDIKAEFFVTFFKLKFGQYFEASAYLRFDNFYRTRVRSLVMLVSDSLPHSCLVNLIDVILACEDGNSKLIEIVTVANIDDEDRVGNSLLHTSELRLGNKAKLLFRL